MIWFCYDWTGTISRIPSISTCCYQNRASERVAPCVVSKETKTHSPRPFRIMLFNYARNRRLWRMLALRGVFSYSICVILTTNLRAQFFSGRFKLLGSVLSDIPLVHRNKYNSKKYCDRQSTGTAQLDIQIIAYLVMHSRKRAHLNLNHVIFSSTCMWKILRYKIRKRFTVSNAVHSNAPEKRWI